MIVIIMERLIVIYLVVVVEVLGVKCCVLLDIGVGSLYVLVVLFDCLKICFY